VNVARFFKQTAILERRTVTDAYNGTSYGPPSTIAVRWFTDASVVLTNERREVTSNARISTLAEVSVGDRVTDESGRQREVVQVRFNRGTRGDYSHRVAYLL
jgi:hypothetical protein